MGVARQHASTMAWMDVLTSMLIGSRCAGCDAACTTFLCQQCTRELEQQPRAHGAAWLDDGVAGTVVRRAKHGLLLRAGPKLASMLLLRCPELSRMSWDAVTWVPADPVRRARRGACLPRDVARSLGMQLGVPAIALLARSQRRPPQRGLSRAERANNAHGAFRLRGSAIAEPAPLVLLVDDVRTTGATLNACARVLAHGGASVATIALLGVETPQHAQRAAISRSRNAVHLPMVTSTNCERQHSPVTAPRPP